MIKVVTFLYYIAFILIHNATKQIEIMTNAQINTELKNTKKIMDALMVCIEEGKMEFYKDYMSASIYYLKLSKLKPSHNLTIA